MGILGQIPGDLREVDVIIAGGEHYGSSLPSSQIKFKRWTRGIEQELVEF
jgi:hypothetical protein